MVFEVFIGVFSALVLHSLVQTYVIDQLTIALRVRRLEKAANAFKKELDKVGMLPPNPVFGVGNPSRTRFTPADEKLSSIFNEELESYLKKHE